MIYFCYIDRWFSLISVGQTNINHSSVLISVDSVPELRTIILTDDGLVVGAAVTVAELEAKLLEIKSHGKFYRSPSVCNFWYLIP